MKRFALLYRELDATTSTNEKVAAMARYFREAPAENAVWALSLLTSSRRKRTITSRTLLDDYQSISGMPGWLLEDCRAHVGDSGETVALLVAELLDGGPHIAGEEALPADIPLHRWITGIIAELGRLPDDRRRARLVQIWRSLPTEDIFVFHKVLTGGFRVGVSRKLVVRALSQASGVPQPAIFHRLMGEWSESVEFYRQLWNTNEQELPASTPYPFFLANAADSSDIEAMNLDDMRVEWKWDGIRAQLVKREGSVWLWSRGEELINEQFPEIEADGALLPDGTVLDGELVAWENARPLSFNHLQQRLGRRRVSAAMQSRIPVHMVLYDMLEESNIDIRPLPLRERVAKLRSLLETCGEQRRFHTSEALSPASRDELEALRSDARERGVEGLMLKALESHYGVGRPRGVWWKYKVEPFTLDAVLVYAQAGSGKRANLFTDYTFAIWRGDELVPFAKAYSGLTNEEIAELDRWIRRNTVEKFGPVRSVAPERVFEIAFEGISPSKRHKSGLAVRFPRILRPRPDKPASEADTMESATRILRIFFPEKPHTIATEET